MTPANYNQCVKDYSDALFRFIVKNLRDEFEAENIVQNTLEKLWVRREKVEMKTAKAFLFKIAYNNMIDVIRKRKQNVALEEVPEREHSYSDEYTGIREHIDRAVAKLPENQQAVIMLRDYEGYDYKSIGEITGQSESQVKINIFRARKFLKKYLSQLEVLL